MHEPRLFRLAPEAVTVAAIHYPGQGWYLRVCVRRQDETWAEAPKEQYERLSTPELADAVECTLQTMLGL